MFALIVPCPVDYPRTRYHQIYKVMKPQSTASRDYFPLLLLSAELQQIIFIHLFLSYKLVPRRTRKPHSSANGIMKFMNPYFQLAWEPAPGPLCLLLTSSAIYASTSQLLDHHAGRTVSGKLENVSHVDFLQRPDLARRLQYFKSPFHYDSTCINFIPQGQKQLLSDNLRSVTMDYRVTRIGSNIRAVDQIVAVLEAEKCRENSNDPTQSTCGSIPLSTKLAEREWWLSTSAIFHTHHRWYEFRVNVTACSSVWPKKLNFQIVAPYGQGNCRGVCSPTLLKHHKLHAWKEDRDTQGMRVDCACVVVEDVRDVHERKDWK